MCTCNPFGIFAVFYNYIKSCHDDVEDNTKSRFSRRTERLFFSHIRFRNETNVQNSTMSRSGGMFPKKKGISIQIPRRYFKHFFIITDILPLVSIPRAAIHFMYFANVLWYFQNNLTDFKYASNHKLGQLCTN